MKYSFISWDCSFRNFFHLVDSLIAQEYPRNQFELIFVEQRTQEYADAFNHRLNLKSLRDKYEESKEKINIKIFYLNDPPASPYHLGKCLNAGLIQAQGDIISTMDGDLLLPTNFLIKLTKFHEQQIGVVNLVRRMCEYPVGVTTFRDWTKSSFEFNKCLNACKDKNLPIPRIVANKAPLISAQREFWQMIGGFDPNILWSTSVSKSGIDVNCRLELVTQTESLALPDIFAVHPWHPIGYARRGRKEKDKQVIKYLSIQQKLIDWSVHNNKHHWKERVVESNRLYTTNQELVEQIIQEELLEFSRAREVDFNYLNSLDQSTIPIILETKLNNISKRRLNPIKSIVRAASRVLLSIK